MPFVIALEGIDGSGKSTQALALGTTLTAAGYSVERLVQPGSNPVGLMIREQLRSGGPVPAEAMACLFAADRELQRAERPKRDVQVIVLDRSYLSGLAYQPYAIAKALGELAPGLVPDLPIWIRVHPGTAIERRGARGAMAERYDADAKQRDVHDRYQSLFRSRGWPVVDGEQSPEAVTADIASLALPWLRAAGVRPCARPV